MAIIGRLSTTMAATVAAAVLALSVAGTAGAAEYGPGASDTEIKLGNTQAYSGPASAYGTISKTNAAHFNKLHAEGGLNGRKLQLLRSEERRVGKACVHTCKTRGS